MCIKNGTNAQKWKLLRVLKNEMISVSDCILIGNEIANPSINVNVDGNELTESVDYSIQISTDIEHGVGNATITGLGNYCDSVNTTFSIQQRLNGDTNLDGNIDVRDVKAIQRNLAETEMLNGDQLLTADVDGDGVVTVADATLLQMYLAEFDVTLG